MYHQSTAPLPRPARRGPPIAAMLVAVGMIGSGLGFAILGRAYPEPSPAAPVISTAAPRWAPTVGSAGQIPATVVFVEHLGLTAYQRADNDRDSKGTSRVLDIFEYLMLDAPARVTIVERRGDAAHVDILDGPYRGRRGWLPAAWITP